ncbi:hypothetical protein COP1_034818 [Malus domestica]
MLDIIATIYALSEAQKKIVVSVKELKNSIQKTNKKASDKDYIPSEKASQEKSATTAGKGHKKTPSFFTQENVITMLEKELHRS